MKNTPRFLATLFAILSGLAASAQTVPQLINYQGQLLDANGAALPTGDYETEITLFSVESGGAPVWGPQRFNGQSGPGLGAKVPVVDGRFNLILGPTDTTSRNLRDIVGANSSLYLEIKVGNGSPIAPRQQLLTAPYALSTGKLNGHDWNAVFANGDPVNGDVKIGVARLRTLDYGFGPQLEVRGTVWTSFHDTAPLANDSKVSAWAFHSRGGGFNNPSDERLKEKIETIKHPLEVIQGIRGVRFQYKNHASAADAKPGQDHIGVLAQAVQKVLPEAVSTTPDGFLAVNYDALIPVLLEAVKEQQKQIDGLKAELSALGRQ